MVGFDQSELDRLERRDFHLSVLAAAVVLVMAGGVALLMYPLVFVHPDEANKWTLRFAFGGFCLLSVLVSAYLLDRKRTVHGLKQQLVAELKRNFELRHQANLDLLHTIPDLNHFQDRLSMEHRRAASMQRTLSLVVIKVNLSRNLMDTNEGTTALGEAARELSRNLRPTDSIFVLGPGVFGLVLPDTNTAGANRVKFRLEEALKAIGGGNRFSSEAFVYNYPEQFQSAHEMEQEVLSLLPETQPWLEGAETSH
jgi:GGDEF domain-containing protein